MLEARSVAFSYRADRPLLRDVSVALKPGSFLALLGVNGCGKSTLLQCLTNMIKPQAGEVLLDGVPIGQVDRHERARKVAMVAQHSHANRLTVFDSVLLGRRPYMNGGPSKQDLDSVANMLGRLGMEDKALSYVDVLSGGEYQKVVLARAFVQSAQTLLLDEPTNNLDPANQQEIMRAVREEVDTSGIAAGAVLHDINLALRYCDRFMFIADGLVDAAGDASVVTPEEIRRVYGMDVDIIEHKGVKAVIPLDGMRSSIAEKGTGPDGDRG